MIRTLIVDDSKFMRTLISDILVSDSHIDVIATAKDGMDAVAQARLHHPDVITLDVEMPRTLGVILTGMGSDGAPPPTLAFDMAGAVMDYVLATVGTVADQVILFKTVFEGELNLFSGYFMLMPDPESLKNVLKMLGGQIDE